MARQGNTTAIEVNGFAVREIRIRTGIDIAPLAQQVGVGRPFLAKIELGHSKRMSAKSYARLLSALGINDRRALMAHPHGIGHDQAMSA